MEAGRQAEAAACNRLSAFQSHEGAQKSTKNTWCAGECMVQEVGSGVEGAAAAAAAQPLVPAGKAQGKVEGGCQAGYAPGPFIARLCLRWAAIWYMVHDTQSACCSLLASNAWDAIAAVLLH